MPIDIYFNEDNPTQISVLSNIIRLESIIPFFFFLANEIPAMEWIYWSILSNYSIKKLSSFHWHKKLTACWNLFLYTTHRIYISVQVIQEITLVNTYFFNLLAFQHIGCKTGNLIYGNFIPWLQIIKQKKARYHKFSPWIEWKHKKRH